MSGTPRYSHVQRGTVIVLALGMSFLLCGVLAIAIPTLEARLALAVVSPLLLAALVAFGSLSTQVGARELGVHFGPGWIRRTIPLREIEQAEPVRNSWLMGWGIHYIGRGWLWNVSGFDAVELRLRGGRRFRIGTDDPQGLVDALERALATLPPFTVRPSERTS
ncbi:MAG: hypothetical protein IPJ19_09535 [Planctomycetes bacterium]|nr:hypothetical protein [Planctomycetota bacterium]